MQKQIPNEKEMYMKCKQCESLELINVGKLTKMGIPSKEKPLALKFQCDYCKGERVVLVGPVP